MSTLDPLGMICELNLIRFGIQVKSSTFPFVFTTRVIREVTVLGLSLFTAYTGGSWILGEHGRDLLWDNGTAYSSVLIAAIGLPHC